MTIAAQDTQAAGVLGILMLEARFPRILGDIGNAATWPFPVRYRVVPGAVPDRVVRGNPEPFLQAFIAAGRSLVEEGCAGLTTSCGFLVQFQDRLADALGVPVATSALLQAPLVQRALPQGQRVGVLTISAETMTHAVLKAAGLARDTPVAGTGTGAHFTEAILTDQPTLDVARARAENVAAARRLVGAHPQVGAIILECTNMVPYAADIAAATGRPVFSIYTHLLGFQAGLCPPRFQGADTN